MKNKIEEGLFNTIEASLMKKIKGGLATETGSSLNSVVVTPKGGGGSDGPDGICGDVCDCGGAAQ